MVDETTDAATEKQCVVVIRWVDDDLQAHANFIGMYVTACTDAKSIVMIIRDTLLRLCLSINDCRGQCYDGAACAVMQGCRKGLAVKILQEEPRALYTHCYGHSLNLACQDVIRSIKSLKNALDVVFELSKLLKFSSKRMHSIYKNIHAEVAPEQPGFRTLCPTRWTVRSSSLDSILKNYAVIQASLEKFASAAIRNPEMSARCTGISAQFEQFDFLFGVFLGEKILSLADNLSKALQGKSISAVQGQHMATVRVGSLKAMRCDKGFDSFWQPVIEKMVSIDVNEPTLPRRKKLLVVMI